MYQRVDLLLLRGRVQPAREVSKDWPQHWLTGAHFAVPYRNRLTAAPRWTHKPARTPAAGLFALSLTPAKVFITLQDLSLLWRMRSVKSTEDQCGEERGGDAPFPKPQAQEKTTSSVVPGEDWCSLPANCCATMGAISSPSRAKTKASSESITWLTFRGRCPQKLELTHWEKNQTDESYFVHLLHNKGKSMKRKLLKVWWHSGQKARLQTNVLPFPVRTNARDLHENTHLAGRQRTPTDCLLGRAWNVSEGLYLRSVITSLG